MRGWRARWKVRVAAIGTAVAATAGTAVTVGTAAAGAAVTPGASTVRAVSTARLPAWRATEVDHSAKKYAGAALAGVSCVTATRCVAVGDDGSAPAGLLLLTGHGHSWKKRAIRRSSGIRGAGFGLTSVSCAGKACVAVGSYQPKSGTFPLIVTRSGGAWHAIRAPMPANAATRKVHGQKPFDGISDVACATATRCVAAGTYMDKSGFTQGLLLSGHGTKWKAVEAPLGARKFDPNAYLPSVACATATRCVAAGYANDTHFNQFPVLINWSGKRWQRVAIKLPDHATQGILTGVSCAHRGGCGAVGELTNGSAPGGLLVTGSGNKWRAVAARKLAGLTATGPQAIACPATRHCITSGTYAKSGKPNALAVYSGYGTRWAVAKVFVPHHGMVTQSGVVACASAASCVITGQYALAGKAAYGQIFLLFHVGSAWRFARAPLPRNDVPTSVYTEGSISAPMAEAAACPKAAACVVTGTYYAKSVGMAGLVLSGAA